jgi:hypothetical protein
VVADLSIVSSVRAVVLRMLTTAAGMNSCYIIVGLIALILSPSGQKTQSSLMPRDFSCI